MLVATTTASNRNFINNNSLIKTANTSSTWTLRIMPPSLPCRGSISSRLGRIRGSSNIHGSSSVSSSTHPGCTTANNPTIPTIPARSKTRGGRAPPHPAPRTINSQPPLSTHPPPVKICAHVHPVMNTTLSPIHRRRPAAHTHKTPTNTHIPRRARRVKAPTNHTASQARCRASISRQILRKRPIYMKKDLQTRPTFPTPPTISMRAPQNGAFCLRHPHPPRIQPQADLRMWLRGREGAERGGQALECMCGIWMRRSSCSTRC